MVSFLLDSCSRRIKINRLHFSYNFRGATDHEAEVDLLVHSRGAKPSGRRDSTKVSSSQQKFDYAVRTRWII